MNYFLRIITLLIAFAIPALGNSTVYVGVGKTEITPALGTPSAGYTDRKSAVMEGSHDPLLAIALYIDNGEKTVVFCSVDHLGFTHEMVQEIQKRVRAYPQLSSTQIYIGSSHTHSGGGAYFNIPVIGESLAGKYNSETTQFYIDKTVEAIVQASRKLIPAKVGIGYGNAHDISKYRAQWPEGVLPLSDVAVIKVTHLDETPIAVLFNYPLHPTILRGQNRLFSADFVGYARDHVQAFIGSNVQAIYFNGAQGDIIPVVEDNQYETCENVGNSLANTVQEIWNTTNASDVLTIKTQYEAYSFKPLCTPFGLKLPLEKYETEMNLIVLNNAHAFVTIPGELSTLYDRQLKAFGRKIGYDHVSIFGLTNDAHGYIILPEAWRNKTAESGLSFGGEDYGDQTLHRAEELLNILRPH